ncbi:MAG TPA: hypothetical protein VFG86_16750 [Chloroflexota bacterium]|nr:hypothetical protein [Chloroflexota bacterium]
MLTQSNRIAWTAAVLYVAAVLATNVALFVAPHSDLDVALVLVWAMINLSPIVLVGIWGTLRVMRHARHGSYGSVGACPECLGVMDDVRRFRARLLREEFRPNH